MGVEIEGLTDLIATFEASGKEIKPVMLKGIRAGARIMKDAIASRAPIRDGLPSGDALPPGALKSDIVIHTLRDSTSDEAVTVGPGKYTAHVARWVEYGHRDVHGGRSSKTRGGPGKVGATNVPAHPFIRPAYEESQAEVNEAIEKSIVKSIQKSFGV